MDTFAERIWVLDTSALIEIKQLLNPEYRRQVFEELTKVCNDRRILYPIKVLKELQEVTKTGVVDLPLAWAKKNQDLGCRLGTCDEELETVRNHPIARFTPEMTKLKNERDADPYILATALKLKSLGEHPVVVTQESRKQIPQVPLNIAAGSLGFPSIHLYALLLELGVWQDQFISPHK
ncbi:MAG: DUF4411 family protein [Gammaproteobacteria bacterium]|nr:DUF4411 family protein [Gammaproteobacteria bacterium]